MYDIAYFCNRALWRRLCGLVTRCNKHCSVIAACCTAVVDRTRWSLRRKLYYKFNIPLRLTISQSCKFFCQQFARTHIKQRLFYYARQQILIALLSVRLSVCPSVCHTGGSDKTVKAKMTKFPPSAARMTLVSGTVKLFHKFKEGHPERGR